MSLTIREKSATLATYRFVQVHLLEMLAAWIPTTPETAVKLLLGEHLWTVAQHADALGKRVYELRKPLHYSLPPCLAYRQVLDALAGRSHTAERLQGFYEGLLPGLMTRYQRYLERTDALLDAPTVRLLERCGLEMAQMRRESQEVIVQLCQGKGLETAWLQGYRTMEAACTEVLQPGATPLVPGGLPTLSSQDTMVLRGITLRRDPQREPCFTVVHAETEMHEYPNMSDISRRERLHRHMHNEIGSLEIAAQCLADFPATPWELRMQLARQCWDETRHVQLLSRRLRALGGHQGEFPVSNFEWNITCILDTLPARLAVQNRTFEAGTMDLLGKLVDRWREVGDEQTAAMLEGILVDEIQHVRFANQWIKRLAQEDRRVVLQVAMAMRFLAHVNNVLAPQAGEVNAVGTVFAPLVERIPTVNIADRQQADFTAEEIQEILRQAGFRSLAPEDERQEAAV